MHQHNKLTLLKYQPHEILFTNPQTKIVYKYAQKQTLQPLKAHIIQQAHQFGEQLIYEKELTNLKKEIQKKNNKFTQKQLTNTFEHIIHFALQPKPSSYSKFCPQNIIITHDGNIKLRDNRIKVQNRDYYERSGIWEKDNDPRALALIILQCCLFLSVSQIKQLLKEEGKLIKALSSYSSKFIAMVIILTENIKELYSDLYESQGKSDYMNLLSKIEMHQEKLLHPIEEKVNEQTPKRKVIVVPPINLDKLALIKSKTQNKNSNKVSPKENRASSKYKSRGNSTKKTQVFKKTHTHNKAESLVRIQKKMRKTGINKIRKSLQKY